MHTTNLSSIYKSCYLFPAIVYIRFKLVLIISDVFFGKNSDIRSTFANYKNNFLLLMKLSELKIYYKANVTKYIAVI